MKTIFYLNSTGFFIKDNFSFHSKPICQAFVGSITENDSTTMVLIDDCRSFIGDVNEEHQRTL
jgi:hypothetical protein